MRILYISQYFPPEAGATQDRAFEMARNWVRLGHDVTMLTEVPNHPSGIIHPGFRGKLYQREKMDGIDVLRVWVKASPKKNFINRILFYLSFMFNAALAGLIFSREKVDFIYATSPPLFVGAAAQFLSAIKRSPLVFEVRDLWPESAVVLGELTNSTAIKLSRKLEESCYNRSIRIVVVTKSIRQRLLQRGFDPHKIITIPNGANVDRFYFDKSSRIRLRSEYNLENKFIVIYAGIFGIAQGLDLIIHAADRLRLVKDIHFILIGEGPEKENVSKLCLDLELPNVTILDGQPLEAIPAYLSMADTSIVPLKDFDLFKGALPSKIFHAWACERPVIISVDGEAKILVEEANAGIFISPEDIDALVKTIVKLRDSPEACLQMGVNGRKFTLANYSREMLARKLIDQLYSAVNSL